MTRANTTKDAQTDNYDYGQLQLGRRTLLPGMLGEAHVLSGQKTILTLFWDWLRGADPWS